MTRYWVIALIVAVVALLFGLRRMVAQPRPDEHSTLVPHGDGERELVELDPLVDAARDRALTRGDFDDRADIDDTAPAVLSPPEWRRQRSASNR